MAFAAGATIRVHDLTHVPLQVCIARDAARAQPVGEHVIRDFHTRYLHGRSLPLPLPWEADLA